jgi:hypothetical protein
MSNTETSTQRQNRLLGIIAAHLKAQGGPARNKEMEQCVFRGPNNTKCAVGAIILDEDYNPKMEHAAMYHIMQGPNNYAESPYVTNDAKQAAVMLEAALEKAGVQPEDYKLLSDLMDVHDSEEWDDTWEWSLMRSALVQVAKNHFLDPAVIPE